MLCFVKPVSLLLSLVSSWRNQLVVQGPGSQPKKYQLTNRFHGFEICTKGCPLPSHRTTFEVHLLLPTLAIGFAMTIQRLSSFVLLVAAFPFSIAVSESGFPSPLFFVGGIFRRYSFIQTHTYTHLKVYLYIHSRIYEYHLCVSMKKVFAELSCLDNGSYFKRYLMFSIPQEDGRHFPYSFWPFTLRIC